MSSRADDDDFPDEPDFADTVAEPLALPDDRIDLAADEAPPLALLPTIGYVGRYALKQPLGIGGLGTVHSAIDPLLGRAIAVKTLHLDAQATQGQPLDALLLHEARAAAALSHPHIVTVYDAGLAPEGVYIAMERLQGRDLRHLLADGWRPAPEEAALIVRRVADALAYAHSKGVIHCDIKPANIFMVGRAQPKVLDFGIARVTYAGADKPERAVLGGGSPYYMAPEQLRGEPVDVRCDVYALGTVLHELLTGQRAFEGRTLDDIRDAVLNAPLRSAAEVDPAVPAVLSEIATRAMARDPEQRWRSARALSRALRQARAEPVPQPRAPSRAGIATALAAAGALAVAALLWWPGVVAPPAQVANDAQAAPRGADASATTRVAQAAPAVVQPAPQGTEVTPAAASAVLPMVKPKRTRDGRSRAAAPPAGSTAASDNSAPAATGVLQLAVSPWGEVEVNGRAAGTTPPLARLTLPSGTHHIVVRNDDFPPYRTTVTVGADRAATVRHRFGS